MIQSSVTNSNTNIQGFKSHLVPLKCIIFLRNKNSQTQKKTKV